MKRPDGIINEFRDCSFFLTAALIRLIGVGIFNAFFNIYFIENGSSENFLGVFLAVGNAAMALASYPIGVLIDRISKKKLLILFTLINLGCYAAQIFLTNRALLLAVSVIFGISFIGLGNATGPFLYGFSEIGAKANLHVIYRIVHIIAVTAGAGLAGRLQSAGYAVREILILSPVLGAISIIPQLLMRSPQPTRPPVREGTNPPQIQASDADAARRRLNPIQMFGFAILFGAIGFSPMITNYINLYLQKRIAVNLDSIAYGCAGIYFLSGFIMIAFAKYKIRSENFPSHLAAIALLAVAIYAALYAVPVFSAQIICITLLICGFEIFASALNDYIFTAAKQSDHGKYAGATQMVSNFTETIGIVLCGKLLGRDRYASIFLLSAVPIVLATLIAGIIFSNRRYQIRTHA